MPDRRHDEPTAEVTRRSVLRGAVVSTVALPLLAACGDDAETSSTPAGTGPAGGGPPALASTVDVPVGSGEILKDVQIVLTQPTKGDFKAFTAVCTHQQCLVGTISKGIIHCPCHGSGYSIADGSVVEGPAPLPLAPITITVKDGKISRA